MLRSGDRAPQFSLPDADMEIFDFASVLGKLNVVLYFYPRDNTPGCTRQATDFSDHKEDFDRLDCVIIGVSPDDCLTHAEFRDEHGLAINLLSDEDGEVCRLYDVLKVRDVDGLRRAGVVRSTFVIDREGIIRSALYDVSPKGHAAEVFELVKQLETRKLNANR
ncbi:MAG: peroxiredoxin [Rhodocyclaceae bacterium]|nr:peroxiredoxin [Rhodocyclaceae bacterium]MCP5232506.1 peroxiredoxin [Zoogloeaceae bacterium]MCB1910288.1 peroxiredoxin [Rhodocyclaceae bacterium]MCP5238603.1 peroxiredoxin [Zoogloeaceae bacterium]MCP5254482.1 peroxiredoxin [Zoogloeaceae bacterium]